MPLSNTLPAQFQGDLAYATGAIQPFPEARFVRDVADPKIRIFDHGQKRANKPLEYVQTTGKSYFYLRVRAYPFHDVRISKMLAVTGADRLQIGMRGVWGKPVGIIARVHTRQIMISVQELRLRGGRKSSAD
ncbi:hypothetical protein VTL71DRAFT_8206 [Oculimacula yallundae]|uniref:Uncharacterized protein n=1 Tax=Oculimacula yallundae TaxID=86028 RepID=A0ABR4CX77_9HELO